MDDKKSLLEKWYLRLGFVVSLLSIPLLLFTLSQTVRDETRKLFGKKPAANIATGPGSPAGTPGSTGPSGETPERPKPGVKGKPLEALSAVKALPGHYLNTAILRREGVKQAAILVSQENGGSLLNLES